MTFPAYPANKKSGFEWLGAVPEHWSITPLKFSASCNDAVLPDSTDDDYEIEYVEISDVNEISGITGSTSYKFSDAPSRARRMLQDGDVLISTVRTYLRAIAPVVSPPENLIASTGFAVVRPRKGILDGTFLGYLLRAEWWISEVIARSVGVSYPAINASDLIGLNIPVPALHEQTQIARFLDHETARIDALIEEQQRLIELLKEKRQAVISHAVTKGLDPTVPMKDSGVEWLGEVPAHWDIWKFSHFAPIITCGVAATPDYFDEGVPFLSAQNVKNNRIDLSKGFNYISKEKHEELTKNRAVKNGDILLSRVGTIGEVCIVDCDFEFSIFVSLTHIRLNQSVCQNEYFVFLCESKYVRSLNLAVTAFGGGVGNLNVNDLTEYDFPIPPIEEQLSLIKYIGDVSSDFKDLILESEKSLALLNERRSALISAAVTGKIDVRGWQPPASAPTPELVEEAV